MYRCEACQTVSPPHRRAGHVVVEARTRHYPHRRKAVLRRVAGKKNPSRCDDPGGTGWETVRTLRVCEVCERKLTAEQNGTPPLNGTARGHAAGDAPTSADSSPAAPSIERAMRR